MKHHVHYPCYLTFFSTVTGEPFKPLLDIRSLGLDKGTVRMRMATGCTLAPPTP